MSRTIAIGFAAGLFLIPSAALAGNYQTCIMLEVDTVDSGFPISTGPDTGLDEDHWTTCNSGCTAIARGIRVKVARGAWSQTYDSDPATGCFDWSHAETSGFTLTVYGYATNVKDTFVRIHDGDYNDTSTYPGATYSAILTNITPTNGGSNTYYVGDYVPRWTTLATLAFGIHVYDTSNTNKEIHVAFDYRTNCTSSGNYTGSTAAITSGRSYIFIADPVTNGCNRDHSSRKFVTTHELGHILLRLHANINSIESAVDYGHNEDGSRNPDNCGTAGTTYSMRSKEWNVVGFKEGFAHFVAARIWNNKAQSGAFRWFESTTHDLERYAFGGGTGTGGRLENECCTSGCATSWDSAGTNEDWLHFLWDFYNNNDATCTSQPDGLDMYNLYKQVRTNGGLSSTNYFEKMEVAVTQIGLPSCLSGTIFDSYASLNGIDNE